MSAYADTGGIIAAAGFQIGSTVLAQDEFDDLTKIANVLDLLTSTTVAGGVLAIPVTHRYVAKTTGGAEALTLANGIPNQRLTISLVSDGGDGTLTPTTKTGFSTIVFADVKDTVTLEYIDDTVGWIIVGAIGTAAGGGPPVIT